MFNDNPALGWTQSHVLPRSQIVEGAAVFLTAAGIAFAIWARFYLGQNWSSAVTIKVGHQLIRTGPYAWVRFSFDWEAEPGSRVLACRARDASGLVQPDPGAWNLGGYANNGIQTITVMATDAAEARRVRGAPASTRTP